MNNIPNEIIPYSFLFIFLIFFLDLKKSSSYKKTQTQNEIFNINDEDSLKTLKEAEKKLLALKDLYKQELIDTKIYLSKTELIATNLSNEINNDIMEIPKLRQKVIFNDLKQEIKNKVNHEQKNNVKTDIDNLISAVDNKIRASDNYEKK